MRNSKKIKALAFAGALLSSIIFSNFSTVQAADEKISFCKKDIDLLAGLIMAEAEGEPYAGKIAVANVVLNRLYSGRWGDSLKQIIYAKNQFAKPKSYYTEDCWKAALAAINGENKVPEHILYFQRAKQSYFYGSWYCTIGQHNFYG